MWRGREPEARYRVGLDLGDPALHEALAEAIEAHPALVAAGPGEDADLVIGDGGTRAGGVRMLRVDAGPLPEGAPPELVVSAAHVMAAGMALERAPTAAPAATVELTPREREVLALMVDGAPNKLIARALGISERTAKFHVAAILGKLGARNRGGAVAIALREGLVVL
jgi:DNA-binding CsgD family transcriptional regulator